MRRHELTDEQWDAIKDLFRGRKGSPGVTAKDNRLFVNAVLYVAETGIRAAKAPALRALHLVCPETQ